MPFFITHDSVDGFTYAQEILFNNDTNQDNELNLSKERYRIIIKNIDESQKFVLTNGMCCLIKGSSLLSNGI